MTSHLKKKITTIVKIYTTSEFIINDISFEKKNKQISLQK